MKQPKATDLRTIGSRALRGSRAGIILLLLLIPGLVWAQAPPQVTGPQREVPKPPAGSGVIRGQAQVGENPAPLADLPVALYALRPDGAPGLMGTRTDAEGRFVFEGISSAGDITYLVGTEYLGVPFAQRAVFAPGQNELIVQLTLQESVESGEALEIPQVTYKFDWVGGQLFVQVSHRVVNPMDEVIYVNEDRRDAKTPIFSAALPEDITEYIDGQGGKRSDLVREGDRIAFWGPIYPGPQDIRYGYLLNGPDASGESPDDKFEVVDALPSGAGQLRVLVAAGTDAPQGNGLADPPERIAIDEVEYASYVGDAVAPGGPVRLTLPVPASSSDLSELEISRADFWIDHDDTAIRVSAEMHVSVAGTTRLLAPVGGQLLNFDLPPNAEFLGLSGSTRLLGVEANGQGGLAVRGPLAPGPSVIGYRYRIPVEDSAQFDLRFERGTALLNVLVADTGVIIESARLHRKRPFKQGTRFYLHREAYQIADGETVSIKLTPLQRGAGTTAGGRAAALALAGLAAFFMVSPLRGRTGPGPAVASSELALEREILYESIHDLDHDFETGKIDDADFRVLREELRGDAIALMREERLAASKDRGGAAGPRIAAVPGPESVATCPGCGIAIQGSWSFCAGCGSGLEAGQEPG